MTLSLCPFVRSSFRSSIRPSKTLFFFSSKWALKPYKTLCKKNNKNKECTYPSQLPDPMKGLFIFKQFFSQHRTNRCDCWGPDGRLDTKNGEINWCHISMSYASYDIKCHIMTNDAYDIEIWHKSISVNLGV